MSELSRVGAAREPLPYAAAIQGVVRGHHPQCFQVRPEGIPDGLPSTLCDCRTLWMLAAGSERQRADEEQAELRAEVERLWAKVHAEQEQVSRRHEKQRAAESRLDALVADLRGLADSKGSGFPYVQTRELRVALDKHAGEQTQGGDGA